MLKKTVVRDTWVPYSQPTKGSMLCINRSRILTIVVQYTSNRCERERSQWVAARMFFAAVKQVEAYTYAAHKTYDIRM